MDKKLTLSLNAAVIDEAKKYASQHQTSLSRLIESYLQIVVKKNEESSEITPLVQSLIGVVELPNNYDYRSEYGDYLLEKYK